MTHKIILISGKMGSGKTTLADSLTHVVEMSGQVPYRTRFAKALYLIHDAARDKAHELGVPYPKKFGELLQILGTDLGRMKFGEDVWVNAVKQEIKNLAKSVPFVVIIDDCRFENEFHAFDNLEDVEVYTVRLMADKETRKSRCSYWRENDQHPSETGLDQYQDDGKFQINVFTSNNSPEEVLKFVVSNTGL